MIFFFCSYFYSHFHIYFRWSDQQTPVVCLPCIEFICLDDCALWVEPLCSMDQSSGAWDHWRFGAWHWTNLAWHVNWQLGECRKWMGPQWSFSAPLFIYCRKCTERIEITLVPMETKSPLYLWPPFASLVINTLFCQPYFWASGAVV